MRNIQKSAILEPYPGNSIEFIFDRPVIVGPYIFIDKFAIFLDDSLIFISKNGQYLGGGKRLRQGLLLKKLKELGQL